MNTLIRIACLLVAMAVPAFAQTPAKPAAVQAPARPAAVQAPAKPVVAAPVPASGKVDINGGSEAQLDTLPGIGAARAKAIIAGRPYGDLVELVSKKVLSQSVFDGAKAKMALANINTSSAADLAKTLPGVGDVRAKAIVAGRPYATGQDLVTKGVLTQGVFDKIRDVVAY
jgi:DNA uptake protein ComE-like DNA-binding protein